MDIERGVVHLHYMFTYDIDMELLIGLPPNDTPDIWDLNQRN